MHYVLPTTTNSWSQIYKEAVLKADIHKESILSEQLLQEVSFLSMDISIVGILSTLVVAFGETMNFFNSKQMVSHKMNTLHFAMDTSNYFVTTE